MTPKQNAARKARKFIDMTGGAHDGASLDRNKMSSLWPAEHNHQDSGVLAFEESFQHVHTFPRRNGSWSRKGLAAIRETLRGTWSSIRTSNPSAVEEGTTPEHRTPRHSASSSWLRGSASTIFHRRRLSSSAQYITEPPLTLTQSAERPYTQGGYASLTSPRTLPGGGAAARAAAAAQNEVHVSATSSSGCDNTLILRDNSMSRHNLLFNPTYSSRSLALRDKSQIAEPRVGNDTESGIGIEIRDKSEEYEAVTSITRYDPSRVLPEELFAHIVSFLDAASLVTAELVSKRWYSTSNSYHTWRHCFAREYSLSCALNASLSQTGGLGLGKQRPDQDWKRMWKVRKTLEHRWKNGQAAAIYLEGHKDSVYCVQFDENKILTGSRDRTIRVWDAHTYKCIKVLGVPKSNTVSDEPDRLSQTNRGQKPTESIFPTRSLVEPAKTDPPALYHTGSILCLQYDSEIMVTGSSDHSCIVWSMKDDYKPIGQLLHHRAGVLDVCFDSKHIVSCSKDTSICLWDRETGELLRTFVGHRGPVNAVQLRGNLIVSASGDAIAKLWNLSSGLCIKEFPSRDRGLACVEFSPDSRTILVGGNDQVIYHFDANSGELIRELKGHKGLVRSLHLDCANGRVISGSYDNSVKAYDLHTGNMICDFDGWTTSWMLSAKADYRRIVATSQDSRAVIMDFGHGVDGIELLEG